MGFRAELEELGGTLALWAARCPVWLSLCSCQFFAGNHVLERNFSGLPDPLAWVVTRMEEVHQVFLCFGVFGTYFFVIRNFWTVMI